MCRAKVCIIDRADQLIYHTTSPREWVHGACTVKPSATAGTQLFVEKYPETLLLLPPAPRVRQLVAVLYTTYAPDCRPEFPSSGLGLRSDRRPPQTSRPRWWLERNNFCPRVYSDSPTDVRGECADFAAVADEIDAHFSLQKKPVRTEK